ncbi:MAG TPA: hypothetical protein VIA45_09900 [Thermoanaerobaculia bacterium]|jgi:hypothetical protein
MSSAVAIPPPAPTDERPRAVTVIGWVWIVYAAVKLFGGVWGLLVWRLGGVHDFLAKPGLPAMSPMTYFEKYLGGFGIAVGAQIIFASAVLAAASALLRLRPWARTAIEILCWLGLCYVTLFALGWLWAWRLTSLDASRQRFVGLSIALGVLVVLALAFVSMIRALRREEVRGAFRGGAA